MKLPQIMIVVVVVAVLAFVSQVNSFAAKAAPAKADASKPKKEFDHDGCSVYSFVDKKAGKVFWAKCPESVAASTSTDKRHVLTKK